MKSNYIGGLNMESQKSIYDDMIIDLPLNGVELFWSDPQNPKSDYIKNRNKKTKSIHNNKK